MGRAFKIIFSIILLLLFAKNNRAQNNTMKLEILFFSNVNGVIQNCNCGNPSLGGIARIISVIKQKRKNNPNILVIDGGDFFNPYKYPALNNAVVELYQLLQPDIIVLGDQELVEGISFLRAYTRFFQQKTILTNATLSEIKLKQVKKINPNKVDEVRFLSYLDPSAFDIIKQPDLFSFDITGFTDAYNQVTKKQKLIVIFHGTESALQNFLKKYSKIDVILLAHAQTNRVDLSSRPMIIGGGTDGEILQEIHIIFQESITNAELQSIPVSLDITPDSSAMKIIRKWDIK